jgi:hypothetical protein
MHGPMPERTRPKSGIATSVAIAFLAIGGALAACGTGEKAPTPTIEARQPASPISADVAAVFRAFVDAVNRGDRPGVEGLLAPNATWERGPQCAPGQCVGLARLGQEIARDIANHHRLDILSLDVSGTTATARVDLRNEQTRSAGIERIVQIFTVTTAADGKIASFRAVNDLTDPVTASFNEQRSRQ